MSITIRAERQHEHSAIRKVIDSAFAGKRYSNGKESQIVEILRENGKLTSSFVASCHDQVIGHIAVSPILIDRKQTMWFAIGPVAVLPEYQGQGIGTLLVEAALQDLKDRNAHGCVVLGNVDFYARFGFERDANLVYNGAPAKFFQRIVLAGPSMSGEISFDEAFDV